MEDALLAAVEHACNAGSPLVDRRGGKKRKIEDEPLEYGDGKRMTPDHISDTVDRLMRMKPAKLELRPRTNYRMPGYYVPGADEVDR
jgi:hypothetical protein